MNKILHYIIIAIFFVACHGAEQLTDQEYFNEPHRPQVHFSPKEKWMNDPNGLVYHDGQYHLFYQYYPDSTVWGPMHWGHATSTDLVHWQHQPVALYPDSLGYIFSGSAVVDVHNTSGFGKNGKPPLVAIFTHHDPVGEVNGRIDYQVQSLAYSNDNGQTWTKYAANPVIKNPGIKDFRDPKVMWYAPEGKWIMSLATLDRITFYSSPDLKNWTRESDFGATVGAHGGVWECPDLFELEAGGKKVWVLLVSINPGGPNGGSGTQYFTGSFDGKKFTPSHTDTRWIDYGPDNYAGVTWSNTGDRKIFLGWMGNWQYAQVVPTEKWRSAMTVPRDLALEQVGDKYFLKSTPVPELEKLAGKQVTLQNINGNKYTISKSDFELNGPAKLDMHVAAVEDFAITLSNTKNQAVIIGFNKQTGTYYMDRSQSGNTGFEKGFAGRHEAPRIVNLPNIKLTLIIDVASVELFADDGLTAMTQIFFPGETFSRISIDSPGDFNIHSLNLTPLHTIYKAKKKP